MARWRGHSSPKLERVIQPAADELSPLTKENLLVLGPRHSSLVLDPNTNERRKKLETVQGGSPDPVGRKQQLPRDSTRKAVAPYSLGAVVHANDPGRPAENETIYRNSLSGGAHECLTQFHVLNLRVGEPD
jgi:hypothetical protein